MGIDVGGEDVLVGAGGAGGGRVFVGCGLGVAVGGIRGLVGTGGFVGPSVGRITVGVG